jgi:aminopeptidase N
MTPLDRASLSDNLTEVEARARTALISNLSYDISLSLSDDPDAETFESANAVVFDAALDGSETFINLAARSIDECILNGARLSTAEHGFDGARLWLRGLRAGSNRLSVTAQCEYQHTGVGLHRFRDPIEGRVYLYTQMSPFDAHKVVACFDQPDLKARISLAVTAPRGWMVCANGSLLRAGARRSSKTWHFKTTPPLAPYLIALAAGGYHAVTRVHRDIPMALWCRESLAAWVDAQADEIFEITASGLDFFEKYFGFTYPFDQYNQLFVPEFNFGAMENPGCVTFNEAYIHRGLASEAQLQRRANTILHEMAHVHGFGDVATMRWWSDLWLNETFATYMANLALEKASRFANPWIPFASGVKSDAARHDQLVTTHRIADSVPDVRSVFQNFDGITYQKGASVVRQLAAWVGDDAFMRGVQDYFKRYRWGNADLQGFLDCLRRASGRDLTRWGQDWLQTTGLNTFHALLAEANGRYTSFVVEQTAIPTHPTLRAHRAGVGLYDYDAKGMLRLRRRVETDLTGALTPINELVGERVCDLVLLNDGDLTFAKLRFDPRSLETLKADLSKLADPLARALCWAAMWDLTRDGEMPAREFVELVVRHAPAEEDSLLVEHVTGQARTAIDVYGDPRNRIAARERLHEVAQEQVQALGLPAHFKLIWARLLIGTAASATSLGDVAAMLDGHRAIPGIDIDTDLRWLMVGQLAEEGKADVALIRATMDADPTDIGRRRAAACLAARPTIAAKEAVWEHVADPRATTSADWKGAVDGELSIASTAAILGGFSVGAVGVAGMMSHGPDSELLRPFISRYLAALPSVWTEHTFDEAKVYTESLYPKYFVDDDVVAKIALALEGDLPGPALRILREGFDDTLRARRAREVDTEAGIRMATTALGRGLAEQRPHGIG